MTLQQAISLIKSELDRMDGLSITQVQELVQFRVLLQAEGLDIEYSPTRKTNVIFRRKDEMVYFPTFIQEEVYHEVLA